MTVGARLGSHEIVSALGEGGPPSLAAELDATFGGSTVAQARIWL
jgi:hypothetical protein